VGSEKTAPKRFTGRLGGAAKNTNQNIAARKLERQSGPPGWYTLLGGKGRDGSKNRTGLNFVVDQGDS